MPNNLPAKSKTQEPAVTDEEIRKMRDEWEARISKGKPLKERKVRFETSSGIEIPRISCPRILSKEQYLSNLGFAGEFPFTRGIHPTMYRGRFWTMRQYSGFATAAETNRRYRYLLEQGQTGLSVAFDLPTQMGYDSDHPMSMGEVGKVGVAISTIDDMRTLFNGIPLDKVSTSMTINATAAIILAMYIAVAEEQGVSPSVLEGTVQNDILKEYIARGCYIYPPEPSIRLFLDVMEYCNRHLPKWNPVSISGYHIREAGSTAAQEIGFTLANAIYYVARAVERGMDVNSFAERISFFFNAHSNFLEEVAKFRAARRMWATILRERFGVTNDRALLLRFHTQTAGCTLTAREPYNNVVRVTLQALSSVLGGTQSLHTNSFDEALSLPSEESVLIALRTQQIIGYESGVADSADPLGGSYLVEYLTDELEKRAYEYIRKVDELGGAAKAVEKRYFQKEIERSAYEHLKRIESKEDIVVGVNMFETQRCEAPPKLLKVDPAVQEERIARLKDFKRQRDDNKVRTALDDVKNAARGKENLMPQIISAVKAQATLGEISDALREIFGVYKPF